MKHPTYAKGKAERERWVLLGKSKGAHECSTLCRPSPKPSTLDPKSNLPENRATPACSPKTNGSYYKGP